MSSLYYLDHAASMKILPQVLTRFYGMLKTYYGNPHAQHQHGLSLKESIDTSTKILARIIECAPKDILWTSSATESNNMAIHAAYQHFRASGKKVSVYYHTLAHASIISPALAYGAQALAIDHKGELDRNLLLQLIEKAKHENTALIFLLPLGHSETGMIEDFSYLKESIKNSPHVWVHLDAAQALGKRELSMTHSSYITSMSFSGHKIGAPIGIGALYLKSRPSKFYQALLLGGGQQENRRSSTLSAPLIDSFVTALEENCVLKWQRASKSIEALEKYLIDTGYFRSLKGDTRLPHILGMIITKDQEVILKAMKNCFAFSQTTACRSGNSEVSEALLSLGISAQDQKYYCRLSFPIDFNTENLEQVKELFQQKVLYGK